MVASSRPDPLAFRCLTAACPLSRLLPCAPFHSAAPGRWATLTPRASEHRTTSLAPSEAGRVHASDVGRCRTRATYPVAAPDPADPSAPTPLRLLVVSPLQTLTPIRNSRKNSRKSLTISLQTTSRYLLQSESNSFAIFFDFFIFLEDFLLCGFGHGRAVMQ